MLFSACSPADTLDTSDTILDCDLMVYPSVNVNVIKEDGTPWPIDGTYLWYSVDGNEEVPATNASGQWVAGYGQTGSFTLRAGVDYWVHEEACSGYWIGESSETFTVGLTEDGCHVDTVTADIVVTPDCVVATTAS